NVDCTIIPQTTDQPQITTAPQTTITQPQTTTAPQTTTTQPQTTTAPQTTTSLPQTTDIPACGVFQCPGDDLWADPCDCHKYYICSGGIASQYTCSAGTLWFQNLK
ncbi:hypothetical protein SK128_015977, partial [Halocaridina rubra]